MKHEIVRTNTHTDRINDDDALPDYLTNEELEQLFPTDKHESHHDGHSESSAATQTSNSVSPFSISPTDNNTDGEDKDELDDDNDTVDRNVSLRGGDNDNDKKKKKRVDEKKRVNTKKMNEKKNENKSMSDKNNKKNKKRRSEESDENEDDGENENSVKLPIVRKRGRPKKVRFDPNIVTVAVNDDDNDINDEAGNDNDTEDDPATYEQAVNSEKKNEWLIAINDELCAHKKNNTWSVVMIVGLGGPEGGG